MLFITYITKTKIKIKVMPVEIIAVILGAVFTIVGFLGKIAYNNIIGKLSTIEDKQDKMFTELNANSSQIAVVNTKIVSIEEDVKDHEERIGKLEIWSDKVVVLHNKTHPTSPMDLAEGK